MRAALEKEIEQMESALSLWKWKYEELKGSRASHGKEVGSKWCEGRIRSHGSQCAPVSKGRRHGVQQGIVRKFL